MTLFCDMVKIEMTAGVRKDKVGGRLSGYRNTLVPGGAPQSMCHRGRTAQTSKTNEFGINESNEER